MWAFSYFLANLGDYFDRLIANKVLLGLLVAVPVAILGYGHWAEQQVETQRVQAAAVENVKGQCRSWIQREYNRYPRNNPSFVSGVWSKNEHIVVEVGWRKQADDATYRTRLCVYDPRSGRLSSPGAFGRWRWEQY
ncbi:hypothetical protein RA19_10330 [Leisingera sp. ANG-M1]|uniref:hypothetical protein n=1 Tax=Leisingera sp. ANG-M1 TaxID=1577895 RepID=UPI00057C8B4F|nr:hypothetical protein [Leisingera sp. ANG-M1]KIC10779.1 hypothetical protein RA19_10330 [Leisingera sp. ANG-M1]